MLNVAAHSTGSMTRTLLFVFLLGISPSCLAHGDWPPRHGGIMSAGGEITFELVRRGNDVVIYVEDHGESVSTSGAVGTIEVHGPRGKQTAEVIGAGANTLVASGVQIADGDRIRVRAMLPNRTMLNGRLWVK